MNLIYINNKYNIYNYINYVLHKTTYKCSETHYVLIYIASKEKHFTGKEWLIEQNPVWSMPNKDFLHLWLNYVSKVGQVMCKYA